MTNQDRDGKRKRVKFVTGQQPSRPSKCTKEKMLERKAAKRKAQEEDK